jgi:hypothetical protein
MIHWQVHPMRSWVNEDEPKIGKSLGRLLRNVPGLVASILKAVAVRAAAAGPAEIGIGHAHLDNMMFYAFMAALLVAAAA